MSRWLGFVADAPGLVAWDAFDAVLTPGDIILLLTWRDRTAAETFEKPCHYRRARGFAMSAWCATTVCSIGTRRRNITRTRRARRHSIREPLST